MRERLWRELAGSAWDAGAGFWRGSEADLLGRLASRAEGLSAAEASERLARCGPNRLQPPRQRALLTQYLSRFSNPLVLLLLAAAVISATTGDGASSAIVAAIVVLSVTLDFVQEHRAGRAAERLRERVAVSVAVLRDGEPREVPAAVLVPGDVVLLGAGNLVPADGRLLDGRDLHVGEALLTGEPMPVGKDAAPCAAPDGALADVGNSVFMGTSVVSGAARVLVCRTGDRTALGEISRSLSVRAPISAFEIGTRRFGGLILRLAVAMVLFVVLINAWRGRPLLETFLFAVALAVGLTPELLPTIVSVTLARGALRMAAARVIVKRLAAILDLGSMDVLCTDKTGTLTEARIRLERHLDANGEASDRVLELIVLNSRFSAGLRNSMDEAVLAHAEVDLAGWGKIDEVPFDYQRRRVSLLVGRGSEAPLLVVKGALEDVLRAATLWGDDRTAAPRPLDGAMRRALEDRFAVLSGEGYRVLGVAWKRMPDGCCKAGLDDERELVFAGFAAFEDPPKESARAALAALAAAGVEVKIVTGDNEVVTEHLCRQLGIVVRGVLTGAAIERLDDAALAARAPATTLFCRVPPATKNRVLLALKRRQHVVGFLGDGINDAPSLHSADVGISVDSGVDVAKEAADMILLDRDLAVLHRGVIEGRRTFSNIMKYILMATSSNFGNMFSMAGAALFLPFLPMLPIQVLLNNLLYDVSEIPIPMDSVDEAQLARPRRWDMGFIARFMAVVGPVSSVFDFLTFYLMFRLFAAPAPLFHTGWFVESLATQVLVIFVIRTRGAPWASRPSRLLTSASLAVVGLALALPFLPVGRALGFVPLPSRFFAVLAVLVATYLCAVEAVKRWLFRHLAAAR